jgi:hypothetical protein
VSSFRGEHYRLDLNQARPLALSVRYDLLEILRGTGLGAICVALIRKDFEELVSTNSKAKQFFGPDPVRLVYKRLIRATIELLEKDWPGLPKDVKISFTFDTHAKWREAEEQYEALKLEDEFCARRMLKVGHADDKEYAGLQMADLVAAEGRLKTMQFMDSSQKERLQFKQMAKNENLYFLGVWARGNLLTELADAEAKGVV